MESIDFSTIITLVLGLVATFASGYMLVAKKKIKQVVTLVKETYDLLNKVEIVLSDDKVTKDEIEQVKKEAADVKMAFKELISKEG